VQGTGGGKGLRALVGRKKGGERLREAKTIRGKKKGRGWAVLAIASSSIRGGGLTVAEGGGIIRKREKEKRF